MNAARRRLPIVILGAAFAIVAAVFAYILGGSAVEDGRYRSAGQRATAVVSAKALRRATSATSTVYELTYELQPESGRTVQKTEAVPVHVWERTVPGSVLPVEYLPAEPATVRLVHDAQAAGSSAVVVAAALMVLALIAAVAMSARSPRAAPAPVPAYQQPFWPLARASSGFWFGAVALPAGLTLFSVNILVPVYQHWQFARHGRTAEGVVLTKDIRRSGQVRSETKHYEVTYRFVVDGEALEARDELAGDAWERLVEREPVDVVYLADDSASSRLAGSRPWLFTTLFGLVGALFGGIGGAMLVRAIRDARGELRR